MGRVIAVATVLGRKPSPKAASGGAVAATAIKVAIYQPLKWAAAARWWLKTSVT
jgi:hypothetical protein